jgi:anthranilate phosphoribosyltransferase
MILDFLHRLSNHSQSLTRAESRDVMAEVLAGKCTDAQIAALLVALRMKGETVEEIVGFAEAIRAAAAVLPIEHRPIERIAARGDAVLDALDVSGTGRDALAEFDSSFRDLARDSSGTESSLVDTSGTGGDASGTFNISTATAFVTAGAGVRVAKHGNRSISSKCGSADVMEALGVNIQLSPEGAAQCLREVGICFLYAPNLHPAMKQVQAVRRELRMRTMFNLLGPLTNPARASGQVVGVYALDLVEKLAEALSMLGLHRALVVHGLDGLDEVTITGPTRIAEARDGSVKTYEVTPEELGMTRATLADISGGDATENAAIIRAVLEGKKSPHRDVVLLNSAAALVAAGRADHLAEAVPIAAKSIDSGAAAKKLAALVKFASSSR